MKFEENFKCFEELKVTETKNRPLNPMQHMQPLPLLSSYPTAQPSATSAPLTTAPSSLIWQGTSERQETREGVVIRGGAEAVYGCAVG
jgi:hypothetical protein